MSVSVNFNAEYSPIFCRVLVQEPRVTGAVITSEVPICFVAHGTNIVVLDSHRHGHYVNTDQKHHI